MDRQIQIVRCPLYIHYNESETDAPKVRNKHIDVIQKFLIIFYCSTYGDHRIQPASHFIHICSWISFSVSLSFCVWHVCFCCCCCFGCFVFFMLPQANAYDIWIVWIDETIIYENDNDADENNNENDEHRKLYDLLNGSIFEQKSRPISIKLKSICTVVTCTVYTRCLNWIALN